MIDIKDEILNVSGQPDVNPRYTIRDNNGNIINDDVQIEMKTPVIQQPTPLNKKLFQDFNDDIIPVGSIRIFSNIENRTDNLLCDGSDIYSDEYPNLIPKLKNYDFYEYMDLSELDIDSLTNTAGFKYLNGYFILLNDSYLIYSRDGETWTKVTLYYPLVDITYGNGKYYAVTRVDSRIYVSENLNTWNFVRSLSARNGEKIFYKDGILLVGLESGLVYYSTDGDNFSVGVSYIDSSIRIMYLGYFNNKFVACMYNAGSGSTLHYVYRSNDGITWTQDYTGDTQYYGMSQGEVVGSYLYFIQNNYLCRTNNGYTIRQVKDLRELNNTFQYFTFLNNTIYLFPTTTGTIKYSTNFTNWFDATFEGDISFQYKAKDNNVIITLGEKLKKYYGNGSRKKMILPNVYDSEKQMYGYIRFQ